MSGKDGNVAEHGRHDRLIKEYIHDPYMTRSKPIEPTVCPKCSVVYTGGRWQWLSEIPPDAREVLCPACQRIRDKVPAGYLILGGQFFNQHRVEIMNLVNNKVEQQMSQHPMKRLMGIEVQENKQAAIMFTDVHLPRSVGEAIQRAYEGELDIHYTDEAGIVRVYWKR